jgi:type IX secretion system PorP/SprF family membrane protein
MMKNYNILVFLVLLFVSLTSTAQQMPQYTQYILNDFALNPAIAGTQDYYQVKSNYRSQWTGIVDAPVTYILSVYGPHKSKDMGFGALVFNDVTGPTSRAGLYLSYAYNIKIKNDIRLSLGLSAGLLQFKIPLAVLIVGLFDGPMILPLPIIIYPPNYLLDMFYLDPTQYEQHLEHRYHQNR